MAATGVAVQAPPAWNVPPAAAPGGGFLAPPLAAQQQWPPTTADQLPVEVTSAPSAPNRSRRFAMVGAGVLVIGAASVFAVRSFSGAEAGSSSPTAAVDQLFASLEAEDPIGFADSIAPSEIRSVQGLFDEANSAASGEGEIGQAAEDRGLKLDPNDLIPGFNLQIDDLAYDIEEMDSDVAKVSIRSLNANWNFNADEFAAAFDIEKLTDGEATNADFREGLEDNSGSFDQSDLTVIDQPVPFLMAVKEGDGWYVSVEYTVLEHVRIANDLPLPDFSTPKGNGSETPEAALIDFTDAITSADIGQIIDALPPDRYGALYAYRDALRELAGEDASGLRLDVTVDEVALFDDPRGQGVTIVDATVSFENETYDGTEFINIHLLNDCIDATTEGPYGNTSDRFCLDRLKDIDSSLPDEIPGIDRFWVIQQRDGGGWYVDPVATLGSWFGSLDQEAIAEQIQDAIDDELN